MWRRDLVKNLSVTLPIPPADHRDLTFAMLGGSPDVWMRLRAAYDLKEAERNRKVMARVARIVPLKAGQRSSGLNPCGQPGLR